MSIESQQSERQREAERVRKCVIILQTMTHVTWSHGALRHFVSWHRLYARISHTGFSASSTVTWGISYQWRWTKLIKCTTKTFRALKCCILDIKISHRAPSPCTFLEFECQSLKYVQRTWLHEFVDFSFNHFQELGDS